MAEAACTFRIVSGASLGQAAIAMVELRGEASGVLDRLGVRDVPSGRAALRTVKDVDGLIAARVHPTLTLLFPHAGPLVLSRLCEALVRAGCTPAYVGDGDEHACESHQRPSLFQTRLGRALAQAQSPLAIDALLGQESFWTPECEALTPEHDVHARRSLGWLIEPPLVAALGRPNIGKSSLLNALAGRGVSIVADDPGTTRDHVGIHLNLAGLVVRYLDTPGIDDSAGKDAIQAEAQDAALAAARGADLLLLCSDAHHSVVKAPAGFMGLAIVVGVRADLGPSVSPADVCVSVRDGAGLGPLVELIRERLVPSRLLEAGAAWRFWESP